MDDDVLVLDGSGLSEIAERTLEPVDPEVLQELQSPFNYDGAYPEDQPALYYTARLFVFPQGR